MSNNRKGRRGELEWAQKVEGQRISQQGVAGPDVQDKHGRLWEVKRVKRLPESIKMHLRQAYREGAHAVAIREDRGRWIVMMWYDSYMENYFDE